MNMQKNNTKAEIRNSLLRVGRKLVAEKGAAFLTARKLSEASGCSVGTIYNQFANMDNFIMAENLQTLEDLKSHLSALMHDRNPYKTLNRYLEGFVRFVLGNKNLTHEIIPIMTQEIPGISEDMSHPRIPAVDEIRTTAFAMDASLLWNTP